MTKRYDASQWDYANRERVEAVVTGAPPVTLLACRLCGVLLWDIAAHYGYTHGGDYGGL